jgi:hypothetical protein
VRRRTTGGRRRKVALGTSIAAVLATIAATTVSAPAQAAVYVWSLGFSRGTYLMANDRGTVEFRALSNPTERQAGGAWGIEPVWVDGSFTGKRRVINMRGYPAVKKCLAVDGRGGYLLQWCTNSGAQLFYTEMPNLGENGPVTLYWPGGHGQTFSFSHFS